MIDNEKKKNIQAKILFFSIVFLIVFYYLMKLYFGPETIGAFFSKHEFKTRYYVHLFPEGSKSKNYIVPADLYVIGDNIIIESVTWPNGGKTTFNRFGDMDQSEFYYRRWIKIPDDEGREWTIVLTNKKVE